MVLKKAGVTQLVPHIHIRVSIHIYVYVTAGVHAIENVSRGRSVTGRS